VTNMNSNICYRRRGRQTTTITRVRNRQNTRRTKEKQFWKHAQSLSLSLTWLGPH